MARELRRAQKELAAGNYDRAFREYQRHAEEENNALAQFTLGMFYRNGWGRPTDEKTACGWFKKAAAADIPAAAHFYAEYIERGIAGEEGPAEAARWYQKAADLGHYSSLCSLARFYMTGTGVERDPVKALALCRVNVDYLAGRVGEVCACAPDK